MGVINLYNYYKIIMFRYIKYGKCLYIYIFQIGINSVWKVIRYGNRKVVGYFVSKGVDKFGFGFNFLYKEVQIFQIEILMYLYENFIIIIRFMFIVYNNFMCICEVMYLLMFLVNNV